MFRYTHRIWGFTVAMLFSLSSLAQLTTTNLPIVRIATTTPIISSQTQATMTIVNNVSGVNAPTDVPQFTSMIGVELRGSIVSPKSSYSFETWSSPTVSQNVSILGLPAENDWVLISSYADRSFVRNMLSYQLHERMGRYAPRMRLCELIIDTTYKGVYLIGERIKRDSMRVDIANLTNLDVSGEELTGGYIFKIDNGGGANWNSSIAPPNATTQVIEFTYESPNSSDLTQVQKDYIKAYVDSFETAMNASNFQDTTLGWRRFFGDGSFIDYIITQEVSKNEEAYRINTYLYKDKGKKLRIGPLWGAEAAWRNTKNCQGDLDTGFCYNLNSHCNTEIRLVPFWYEKLAQDTFFNRELRCRYYQLRKPGQILDTVKIFAIIDSISIYANAQNALTRNFALWPIWNVPINNEPTPMALNHAEEIANLKAFIKARLAWLDSKWTLTGGCAEPLANASFIKSPEIQLYPNPTNGDVYISILNAKKEVSTISIYNMQGLKLNEFRTQSERTNVSLRDYSDGIYLIQIETNGLKSVKKVLKN